MIGLLIDDGNEPNNNGEGDRLVFGSIFGDDRSTFAAFAIESEEVGGTSKVDIGTILSIRIKPAEQACEK